MALAYTALAQSGLFSHQYPPPPLLPKPGKDNVRLQKLLKRSAKKKAAAQASQSAAPFRSSLSPVNEASPDLEHSDHSSTPPRTPETSHSFYTHQPPRFSVKPVKPYQHVASPYPQRAAFGRGARLSPQTVAPSFYTQPVSTTSSYPTVPPVAQPILQPPTPKITLPTSSTLEPSAVEVRKPAFITLPATPRAPSPSFYSTGPAETRPLTVLTPVVKSKSPRPTFKANQQSRSPKPMFDVPKIRNYTASTSYYETSRTPPVFDMAGLTSIGGTMAQSKTELKRDSTPSEIRPTGTPTANFMGADQQRRTPTISGGTTPTQEIQVQTPASDIKRATPTSEITPASLTSEPKRTTPTTEITVKTAYEYQSSRITVGRPRTPAYRPTTPVFEISRPNPLLFAVSPLTVEQERSRTPKSTVSDASAKSEFIPNGEVHQVELPEAKLAEETIVKSKSEPDISRAKPTPVADTLPAEPLPSTPSQSYQRPKTPTYEASRLLSSAPGFKRPKTPTYGTFSTGASPASFQRPKTPTQVAQKSQKSSYRGLTPAEYAAYGGIKTYSPAFGIATSMTQEETKVEEKVEVKTTSEMVSTKDETTVINVRQAERSTKEIDVSNTAARIQSVPAIVVTQASETVATTTMQDTVSSQIVEKAPVIQETKVDPQKEVGKPAVNVVKREQEIPKASPEVKQPKKDDQDGLKVVRKLFGRAQPTEKKAVVETQLMEKKAVATAETTAKVEQKEESKPQVITETKTEELKTTSVPIKMAAAVLKPSEKKEISSTAAPTKKKEEDLAAPTEKKEDGGALQAEPLLKALQKPKGLKSKMSGWSRLKKHMVVEQEEPVFPEMGSHKESTVSDKSSEAKPAAEKAGDEPSQVESQATDSDAKDGPKATKMWDAMLFQMFSTKENILAQIEMNKTEEEKKEIKDEPAEVPSFAHRLPVLLFSPRFDAKKLREAASRPVTKISTVFEMGLIGRKGKDEEPKDFNRTARGFAAS
uniref:Proline rich 33 n=1 Tax=Neogobius melanostomus TaxID=47308 RepID=A0A8C6S9M5_9GOBI